MDITSFINAHFDSICTLIVSVIGMVIIYFTSHVRKSKLERLSNDVTNLKEDKKKLTEDILRAHSLLLEHYRICYNIIVSKDSFADDWAEMKKNLQLGERFVESEYRKRIDDLERKIETEKIKLQVQATN